MTRVHGVGILGGTLDPIHLGHLDAATAAGRALGLQRVVVMPARVPPHRAHAPHASAYHRFAMAALATAAMDRIVVSDEELAADGPSYTALTLERLASRGIPASQIFFITGADAFAEIATWYQYPAVLELAHFVVVSRPGAAVSTLPARLPELAGRMWPMAGAGTVPADPSILLVDASTADVSSTEIRRRLRAGDSIHGLVPPAVESHILRHGLYSAARTADRLQ